MGAETPLAPEDVARAFNAAITARDFDRVAALLADDVTYEVCGFELEGAGVYDKATILQILPGMLGLFEEGSPRVELTNVIVDGGRVAAEGSGSGRFRNGTVYENRYVFVYEIAGGQVKALREYMDTQHATTLFAKATAPTGASPTGASSGT